MGLFSRQERFITRFTFNTLWQIVRLGRGTGADGGARQVDVNILLCSLAAYAQIIYTLELGLAFAVSILERQQGRYRENSTLGMFIIQFFCLYARFYQWIHRSCSKISTFS